MTAAHEREQDVKFCEFLREHFRLDEDGETIRSAITVEGQTVYLGKYATEDEAARARDAFIIKNGLTDRYKLNFPLKEGEAPQLGLFALAQ